MFYRIFIINFVFFFVACTPRIFYSSHFYNTRTYFISKGALTIILFEV